MFFFIEFIFMHKKYVRRKDLPKPSRVIPKNSMITMDFRPDRLNVHVDDRKKITGVNYG